MKSPAKKPTKFARWMSEQGYTYETLADKLGFSYDAVWLVATGRRKPSLQIQVRFVENFGREEAAKVFADSALLALLETAPA